MWDLGDISEKKWEEEMGRRNRSAQKGWDTRRRRATEVDAALDKLARANEVKEAGSFNQWDTQEWRIKRTSRADNTSAIITADQFVTELRPWVTALNILAQDRAFEIADSGNNFGIKDCLLEIVHSGATIYTLKGVYQIIR